MSDVQQVAGVWLPAHEKHLIEWFDHPKNRAMVDGKFAYQWKKQELAMRYVKNWRTAVDVGAHCGLWSMHLVKRFEMVHAFEPVHLHRQCWAMNVEATPGHDARVYGVALGERDGMVSMTTKDGSSGDTWVGGEGDIPLRRLDDFGLENVDFLKVDCEGFELFVLRGAEETLKRCRPTIIVEQKPDRAVHFGVGERDALPYLESLGFTLRESISGDFVFT